MAKKRKANPGVTTTRTKKQRIAVPNTPGAFRLLDLAPELRNEIYAAVLQSEPRAYLRSNNGGKLFSKSALSRVNRQVREEFSSLLRMAAPELVAEVKNFNFGHVITFLNRMDQCEIDTLPTSLSTVGHRRMIISLRVTSGSCLRWQHGGYGINRQDDGKLQRWLNRMQCRGKKGTEIDCAYEVLSTTLATASRVAAQLEPLWYSNVHSTSHQTDRVLQERSKMAAVFRDVVKRLRQEDGD